MNDCNFRRRCSYRSKRGEREAQTEKIYPPSHEPSGVTRATSVSRGFSKNGHARRALCSVSFSRMDCRPPFPNRVTSELPVNWECFFSGNKRLASHVYRRQEEGHEVQQRRDTPTPHTVPIDRQLRKSGFGG